MGPYERLLLDCIRGDQMLFVREDMVEVSWKFINFYFKRAGKIAPTGIPQL
jgi:glucose-6-phosphate 1-dehydrogenase